MIAKPFVTFTSRRIRGGFTLVELLVSVVVLVIIIFMVSQLMSSATAITQTGNKHIDTDTQARVVFDRMALDFAQMLKRTDIDYYVKQRSGYKGHGNGHGWGQGKNGDKGSDQIAFFSAVPGYYPSNPAGEHSPISLVAYRVNESTQSWGAASYGRLERMAKGLHWAGVDDNNANRPYPIVFAPGQVTANPNPTGAWGISGPSGWQAAINNDNTQSTSSDTDYEVIGPGVFRFEYFYLLKDGFLSNWPWDWRTDPINRQKISDSPSIGLSQVEAIGVAIAVINPEARALIQAASSNAGYGDITDVAAALADFKNANGLGNAGKKIGDMEDKWKAVVESIAQTGHPPGSGTLFPREAAKGIRIYTRYFDLKTL
jgi:prepilin-type N-terminal cleavage/methylation domain-containing protein